jgi:hypothetical protein
MWRILFILIPFLYSIYAVAGEEPQNPKPKEIQEVKCSVQ